MEFPNYLKKEGRFMFILPTKLIRRYACILDNYEYGMQRINVRKLPLWNDCLLLTIDSGSLLFGVRDRS